MSVKVGLSERPVAGLDEGEPCVSASRQRSFDPLVDVSADAKYIVKNLVGWFLVLPLLLGILVFALTR
jgi:hypothetical protein